MRSIILAAAAALIVPPAAAAPKPAAACSQGELTRIRVSKIKPGGTMAGFRQALAAHAAWYKAHGFKLNQRVAPVLVTANGKQQVSRDAVMTISSGDSVPREKHDAGWDAFVARYRANSTVEKETVVCMPA
jgi:hypothetical protein